MSNTPKRSWMTYALLALLAAITATLVAGALGRTTIGPTNLDDARQALTGEATTISVIGDSTGNDSNEWVALWAQRLGQDHRVTLHQWLGDGYRPNPLTYGDVGPEITIWNAGLPGGEANWAVDRMAVVQPERPDLTLLSLGLNNNRMTIASQLNELRNQLDPDTPVVLVIQSAAQGRLKAEHAAVREAGNRWAAEQGLPTIDVTPAFTDSDKQMLDDAHPSEDGSRAWAEVVASALS